MPGKQVKHPRQKLIGETKKEEWLISVNSFFKEMDGFLEKYISENKVSIVYDSKNLIKDYVGEYF